MMQSDIISVFVTGTSDDLRSPLVRFLQEAARMGPLNLQLWDDSTVRRFEGREPAFPAEERAYFLSSLRYVHSVEIISGADSPHHLHLPANVSGGVWASADLNGEAEKLAFCQAHGLKFCVIPAQQLTGFPIDPRPIPQARAAGRKQILVTGSFDWLHTGHVRFFEEVSEQGDLTVVVGHDANIALLKGKGHPLLKQEERLYMVQSIRFVSQALISTGSGWLDAEPEMERLKPDCYAVNEDGDKPEKREYCRTHGIEYLVLKRTPRPGLTPRSSTDLRGF